jgi:transcriptional regulator with XRE-family HTH domain
MTSSASPLREIRTRLGLSQAECAAALGVSIETFRTWDAGRRPAPVAFIERAKTLTPMRPIDEQLPLWILATEFRVNVKTRRAAARDGSLAVMFRPRPFFGRLVATATRDAVATFMARW